MERPLAWGQASWRLTQQAGLRRTVNHVIDAGRAGILFRSSGPDRRKKRPNEVALITVRPRGGRAADWPSQSRERGFSPRNLEADQQVVQRGAVRLPIQRRRSGRAGTRRGRGRAAGASKIMCAWQFDAEVLAGQW